MKNIFSLKYILVLSLLIIVQYDVLSQTNFVWGRQFGSDSEEVSLNAAADQCGNVYVAGSTQGFLSGSNYGKSDGFLAKLDSAGVILWIKQFGTKENDKINWLTIDHGENIYLIGSTDGVVTQSYGSTDIWMAKFDSSGNMKWQQQYGTDSVDVGNGIFVNEKGKIFISGITKGMFGGSTFGKKDCFILRVNQDGKKVFVQQFGTTEDDNCDGITGSNSSSIYVTGGTFGDLSGKNKGKMDAFIGRFTEEGEQIKFIQFGTDSYDMAHQLKVDMDGNIYVGGSTGGDFAGTQQGEGDCFLAKMSTEGKIFWKQQFGTEKWDGILGIDMNELISHNIVVSGCQHWPECQSFVRMFNNDGTLLWIRNSVATGTYGGTCGKGVCLDMKGNIYHTGLTGGNLFNSIAGGHDIFVVKYEVEKNGNKP